jgi:hypothetical protein
VPGWLADRLFDTGEIASKIPNCRSENAAILSVREAGRGLAQHFRCRERRSCRKRRFRWAKRCAVLVAAARRHEWPVRREIYVIPVHRRRMTLPESAISQGMRVDFQLVQTPRHRGRIRRDSSAPWKSPRSHRNGLVQHCPKGRASLPIPEALPDLQPYRGISAAPLRRAVRPRGRGSPDLSQLLGARDKAAPRRRKGHPLAGDARHAAANTPAKAFSRWGSDLQRVPCGADRLLSERQKAAARQGRAARTGGAGEAGRR